MPYHDSSLARGLVKKHIHDLSTQAKNLFRHKPRPLDPPPPLPTHNDDPPEHWMGWWDCPRCKARMYPNYHSGPHPCDFLRCRTPSCKTVITSNAKVSPALHHDRIPTPAQSFVPVERLTGAHREQIPYFTVCTCGLTHRARLYKPSLKDKWKNLPSILEDESVVEKFRRFLKHKEDENITLIEFQHVQCNKCYRKYDAQRWQHFVIHRDAVFHIDGWDEHGRWAEVRHKE